MNVGFYPPPSLSVKSYFPKKHNKNNVVMPKVIAGLKVSSAFSGLGVQAWGARQAVDSGASPE
jgi:hypothetical protein